MTGIIGIDVGTSYSCVSALKEGRAIIIPNAQGGRTTPSVVGITARDNRWVVGERARRQAVTQPEDTVYAIKRLLGRDFGSPEVEHIRNRVPFRIVPSDRGEAWVRVRGRDYSPSQLLSLLLKGLKKSAETFLETQVTDAVISVPAYFHDRQREAVAEAGRMAGLRVSRIINEPTAAALAFMTGNAGDMTAAVFDLGGGTFDISILQLGGGMVEVMVTNGDDTLGGELLDERIMDHLSGTIHGSCREAADLRSDRTALQRLREAAEKARCDLSAGEKTLIELPYITTDESGPRHLSTALSRQTLETLTADLLARIENSCREALQDAGLGPGDVHEVLLVGGGSRIPLIRQKVREIFGREPRGDVNPDEAVAIGTAIQGGIMAGNIGNVLVLDVTSFSLGIESLGGAFQPLIPKNTSLPATGSQIFSTAEDNQSVVTIHVLQGESAAAAENRSLARFDLSGIPPAPKGVPQIEVTFDIDTNGLIKISARDLATGRDQSVEVRSGEATPNEIRSGEVKSDQAKAGPAEHPYSQSQAQAGRGASGDADAVLNCPKCGTVHERGKRFCRECGSPLNTGDRGLICPACNRSYETGKKFCRDCGSQLRQRH